MEDGRIRQARRTLLLRYGLRMMLRKPHALLRELRQDLALHFVVGRISRDSDNLRVELSTAATFDALADGIAAEIELLDERLVDDGNLRRVDHVGIRNLAAGKQRHT
jgi:hypothetical protein